MTEAFKNYYFILRHGESIASSRHLIWSNLTDGTGQSDGLTKNGEDQVKDSLVKTKQAGWLDQSTIIYSSPFSRCRRSAEIAKEQLSVKTDIIFDERLKERWFGDWDKTSDANYSKVWDQDNMDSTQNLNNVESVMEVKERTFSLIGDLERKYSGRKILLVSHGDPLQILEAALNSTTLFEIRKQRHLEKGEIRKLI